MGNKMIELSFDKMRISEVFSTGVMAGLIAINQNKKDLMDTEVRGDLASLMQFAELMDESRETDAIIQNLEAQVELKRTAQLIGLTDEEIQRALNVTSESSNWNMIMVLEWAKKIETAILEKNA